MTTIEMLKELVTNGGMFESGSWHEEYVKYDGFDIEFINKSTNQYSSLFPLTHAVLHATWKPYVKPVDWSKVAVDTKVLVKVNKGFDVWIPQHFAGIGETGKPTTWDAGRTSHTTAVKISGWEGIKLAEGAE